MFSYTSSKHVIVLDEWFIGLRYMILLTGLSCLPLYAQATLNVSTLPELREADFIHPGLLHNQAELDFIKQKVQAEEEPWFSGWKKLLDVEVSSMDWKTGAIADVLRGGYNKPDIGASDLERDSPAASCMQGCLCPNRPSWKSPAWPIRKFI